MVPRVIRSYALIIFIIALKNYPMLLLHYHSHDQKSTDTYVRHLAIKFPTPSDIGTLKGDQLAARECYSISMRGKGQASAHALVIIEEIDEMIY